MPLYIRDSRLTRLGPFLQTALHIQTMSAYEFTCPDCQRAIPVTEPMRAATLSHGCPICGRSVTEGDFAV